MKVFNQFKSTLLVALLLCTNAFGLTLKVKAADIVIDPSNRPMVASQCAEQVSSAELNLDQTGAIALQINGGCLSGDELLCFNQGQNPGAYLDYTLVPALSAAGEFGIDTILGNGGGIVDFFLIDNAGTVTSEVRHPLKKRGVAQTNAGAARVGYFTTELLEAGENVGAQSIVAFGDWRINDTNYATGSFNMSFQGVLSMNNNGFLNATVVYYPKGTDTDPGGGGGHCLKAVDIQGNGGPITVTVPFVIN